MTYLVFDTGHQCYRNIIANDTTKKDIYEFQCMPGCWSIEYTPYLMSQFPINTDKPRNKNDDVIRNYIYKGIYDPATGNTYGKPNPLIVVDQVNVTASQYESEMTSKLALININFGEPQATVITKDAKVTFPDMLANVGGTFGIFLGFSFLGVYDFFAYIIGQISKKES